MIVGKAVLVAAIAFVIASTFSDVLVTVEHLGMVAVGFVAWVIVARRLDRISERVAAIEREPKGISEQHVPISKTPPPPEPNYETKLPPPEPRPRKPRRR